MRLSLKKFPGEQLPPRTVFPQGQPVRPMQLGTGRLGYTLLLTAKVENTVHVLLALQP